METTITSAGAGPAASDSAVGDAPVSAATPTLRIRELHTTFRSRGLTVHAVRGVDLDLHPGEITVLLGESGSGKSVTAKSVMRLYGANARFDGSVQLEGRELLTLSNKEMLPVRGGEIAMVPQDPTAALDPLRRVGAQLVEVLRQHKVVPDKAAARERALELLAQVGIPDPRRVARSFPHELSGGMRQRAVIAIAVSCNPKVLIADEPTTALDVTVQAQILDLFGRLIAELHSAVLLVTHDVGVAEEVGDRVGVMYAGRIVEFGPAGEVLRDPRHPYTRALLDSIPSPGVERGRLRSIVGQPPVSGELPAGCAFAARCPDAFDRCRRHDATLVSVGERRQAACHLLDAEVPA
ncbi:MAG: ABC transporter ATP-binding protein [Acidimicrobiales bacterium]